MSTENEEDILESMLSCEGAVNESVLTLEHHAEASAKKKAFASLETEGYISASGKGWILTEKGQKRAQSIARKHAVLESFLTEVIGKNSAAATKEASLIEHSISTETINRLESMLLEQSEGHESLTAKSPVICLDECLEGSLLHVSMIKEFAKHSRLIDIGIIPGELIELKRKLPNNSVVIKVKGCDIALSPEIASNIMVERCSTHD